MNTPKVLLAVVPQFAAQVLEHLGTDFDFAHCASLSAASNALRCRPGAILVCPEFDESRMFDLLKRIQSMPEDGRVPVICVRTSGGQDGCLEPGVLATAARGFGAHAFVDLVEWVELFGEERAYCLLREVIREAAEHLDSESVVPRAA